MADFDEISGFVAKEMNFQWMEQRLKDYLFVYYFLNFEYKHDYEVQYSIQLRNWNYYLRIPFRI